MTKTSGNPAKEVAQAQPKSNNMEKSNTQILTMKGTINCQSDQPNRIPHKMKKITLFLKLLNKKMHC